METKQSKLVKSRDLKNPKIINWCYNNTDACIVSGSFHQHSWTYLKKKSICKIKTCKEINGRTVVLFYQHTQIIEISTQIIVIYKYNGVRRTKWVEFKKEFLVGVIFLFYFIRKTLYTDVGAFLKISIVNISCTNK